MIQSHRIGIALDDVMISDQLRSMLQECTPYRSELLCAPTELLDESCPAACAFLDLSPGQASVLNLLADLRAQKRSVAIVLVSDFVPPNEAIRMFRLGASGFVTDVTSQNELRTTITEALELNAARRDWLQRTNTARAIVEKLSPRQRDVLNLVVCGLPNKQIAAKLYLSTRTVEKHRAQLYQKTGLLSAIDLVKLHDDANRPDSDMFGGNAPLTIRECRCQRLNSA